MNKLSTQVKLFYDKRNLRKDVTYEKGNEISRISHIYADQKKLKQKDYNKNGILIRREIFDKDGKIKKEK